MRLPITASCTASSIFYKAAKARGIKPIIGCEIYVAKRGLTDKVHGIDNENRHLVLLCKNETGYRNLVAIVSKAWTDGFATSPAPISTFEKAQRGA